MRLAPLALLLPFTAGAATMNIDVEIPPLQVAEYHRPYVAIWIEREDNQVAAQLAVWYQQEPAQARPQKDAKGNAKPASETAGKSGSTWLPDLRQWWRRGGRSLELPVDGVTGATRPVGSHRLSFDGSSAALQTLEAGNYRLVVEAVREVGGRELLKLPFSWPPQAPAEATAQGKTELGAVAISLTP